MNKNNKEYTIKLINNNNKNKNKKCQSKVNTN